MAHRRNRITLWVSVAVLMAVGVFLAGRGLFHSKARRPATIAYIGRYTNINDTAGPRVERSKFARLHEIILRDRIEQLNSEQEGIEFTLATFDNMSDPRASDSIYRTIIAADTGIVAVIDNTWGAELLPSAAAIRERRIPIIAINADRNNGDFGASTVFTGNDDNVPRDIVAYLRGTLGVTQVNFISETDYALHDRFLEAFAESGITVARLFPLLGKEKGYRIESLYDSLDAYYTARGGDRRTVLVVNAHNTLGDGILEHIDKAYDSLTIVGGQYISSLAALKAFGARSGNRLLVMSRPNDALSKEIHIALDRYRAEWPEYFESPSAPFFIKRCFDALGILGLGAASLGDSIPPTRAAFESYLAGLRGRGVATGDDVYELDSDLVLQKDIDFTMYSNRTYYSLPLQLNKRREVIPNIFFGIDIQDMYDLDVNRNTFRADFFYWIKLDTAYREAEQNIIFQNIKQTESSKELVMEKMDGETLYKLYKVSGEFHNDFELRNFPLDEQELAIKVEILDPSDRLKISFDQRSLDADEKILDAFNVRAWHKLKYYTTVDNRVSSSMRGDPENREGSLTTFKTFAFRLLVSRRFVGPFLEIVLPLVLIGFIAIALLYVKDISFENLGEVSVGTFLGIITFSIALSNISPSSDYLTRADLLFWLTFMVVLVSFMTVIVINSRYSIKQLEGVNIRPIAYVVTIAYPLAALGILLL